MAHLPNGRPQTAEKILRRVAPRYDKAGGRPQTTDYRPQFFTKSQNICHSERSEESFRLRVAEERYFVALLLSMTRQAADNRPQTTDRRQQKTDLQPKTTIFYKVANNIASL